jgi:molecular chaperone GrpE
MAEDETKQESPPEAQEAGAAPAAPDLAAELAQVKDALLRALAETENTRRRGERQAQEARVFAIDKFARDLLAVADNLGRALDVVPDDVRAGAAPEIQTFIEGVALTEKSLLEAFGRHGLRRTGAKGEPFDANLHQAVAQIPSDQPAGSVAEVFQTGFMLAERTLRPAMVAVSAGAPASAPPPPQEKPASGDEPPRPPEGRIDIKV